jgi:hypothetical protein
MVKPTNPLSKVVKKVSLYYHSVSPSTLAKSNYVSTLFLHLVFVDRSLNWFSWNIPWTGFRGSFLELVFVERSLNLFSWMVP